MFDFSQLLRPTLADQRRADLLVARALFIARQEGVDVDTEAGRHDYAALWRRIPRESFAKLAVSEGMRPTIELRRAFEQRLGEGR